MMPRRAFALILLLSVAGFLSAAIPARAQSSGQHVTRRLGKIKAIDGSTITLTPDSGPDVTVTVEPNAHILRLAPGEKDLKNTTPIQLTDLQVGDTIRVRGFAPDDAKTVPALEVIVITSSAVAAVSDQIRQDWQKRGIGGPVTAVNPAAGTVTISVTGFGGKKDILIHTSPSTIYRRYAPDSVKFEDAKPSTLAALQAGDQLRARGNKSADGTEFTAEEIVSGRFRNIAGTVNSVDASSNTINVQDLLSKKPVQVKVSADSQLHKLTPEIAQRIAARLKGSLPPGTPGAAAGGGSGSGNGNGAQSGAAAGGAGSASGQSTSAQGGAPAAQGGAASSSSSSSRFSNGGVGMHQGPDGSAQGGPGSGGQGAGGGGMRAGGTPDFNAMLNRLPTVALADLHKGDAVMIVSTEGSGSGGTAITLLSGVEPILTAAPSASQAMMLAPWSLGGAPGGDAGSQ